MLKHNHLFLPLNKFSPGIVRCGTHSDYGIVTFLFQDEAGGLEVQGVDKVRLHFDGMKLHLAFDPGTQSRLEMKEKRLQKSLIVYSGL